MTRLLALCADDYGLSDGVDAAIRGLVQRGRLGAVSCLVNGPRWPAAAALLHDEPAVARAGIGVGLHFNLTEGVPMSPALAARWPRLPRLPVLLAAAHLGLLPRAAVRAELQAQWSAFVQAWGAPPDHLDGHQHVHHLPGVRGAVLELLEEHPRLRVRDTGRPLGPGHGFKRAVIAGTGGRALGRRLQAQGRGANTVLLGVYDFATADYRGLMQRWLATLPPQGGLVFCHPGIDTGGADDAIGAARARELRYLASDDFAADLAAAGVRLQTVADRARA